MRRKQTGVALLLLLAILFVLGLSLLISTVDVDKQRIQKESSTQKKLTEAKRLLIAYAVQGVIKIGATEDYKPVRMGELPCPDFDANYVTNPPNDSIGANCRQRIGWLPWRSLDAEIQSGLFNNDIWYAVDAAVYNRGGVIGVLSEPVLNRDTLMGLMLNGQRVAAIVIDSNVPLQGQDQRNISDASIAISSFLELENADSDDDYINQASTDTFNDFALGISLSDIMDVVEVLAANVLVERLNLYYAGSSSQIGNLAYPHLANALDTCDISMPLGISNVPQICNATIAGAVDLSMPSIADETDMAWWLAKNEWFDSFSYERIAADEVIIRATHPDSKMKPITLKNGVRL